jgi:UDP-N-acetyl-D-glucosamine dehydrogenase
VATKLEDLGADVRVVDPHVAADDGAGELRLVSLSAQEVATADAVVILTDHDAFDYGLVLDHARYVFDARHRLCGDQVEQL